MKTKITFVTIVLILLFATIVYAESNNVTTQPGSVDDPIITKSYFEQNIAKQVADEFTKQSVNGEKIKQIIAAELAKQGIGSGTSTDSGTNGGAQQPAVPNSGLTVVKLQQGQTLYGGAGTEFIVRTGKVIAVSSDDNGIPDVTSGKDIAAGATVELNHLLIVPREGRGVKPDAKNKQEIYVMVRGSYSIMNADGTKAAS
ncbi:hypothetical protein NLX71_23710 [Paenibacillus sp. MZ04-78.2]|uniref:hypothetical protein n=1 Tax=Paenibacillus sp. MZ04-78.2 TaxID=2962034 RepID=UPI0020B86D08|nr:hypothetical protein [Paenibacillus sp. MZ04-78.2]MCP3776268.1 hypothetical protein [Paenibacillus sp. MZ04-78.2]